MAKMKPDDPAYWMLFDGVESTPVVDSPTCYICRDPEYAQMGLPLCRACPACGGHVQADDTVCDGCGLDDQCFWELVAEGGSGKKIRECFSTGPPEYERKEPTAEEWQNALSAFTQKLLSAGE